MEITISIIIFIGLTFVLWKLLGLIKINILINSIVILITGGIFLGVSIAVIKVIKEILF